MVDNVSVIRIRRYSDSGQKGGILFISLRILRISCSEHSFKTFAFVLFTVNIFECTKFVCRKNRLRNALKNTVFFQQLIYMELCVFIAFVSIQND